jgi:hypothetical protein
MLNRFINWIARTYVDGYDENRCPDFVPDWMTNNNG